MTFVPKISKVQELHYDFRGKRKKQKVPRQITSPKNQEIHYLKLWALNLGQTRHMYC